MPATPPPEDLQFAELVVAQGLCARDKVDECLSFIARLAAEGVTPLPKLGELLARRGHLSPSQLHASMTMRPASTPAPSRTPSRPAEVEAASRDPANRVGRYLKLERLGSGGMGEVWKGWDAELGRPVALKFLKSDRPDELARFAREAQTAARLNHPNIAAVYEVGDAAGRPFIAMQYVAGGTLASLPRTDPRRIAELVRDAALAVHHAHGQGVVHRDLKPHNLMAEGTRVYVMDFGLAKAAAVDASLSVSGAILGTPSYMSPEQARGESRVVGPASDVYGLGATLYHLLAGRPPFEETDVYALLKRVVESDPEPLRRLNPRVDRDLETIVLKCLEKEPAMRYGSAQALAEDLTRWLGGEAILAHPPSAGYRLRKFLARRKAVTVAAAAGLAAVVATLAILVPRWLSERSEKEALRDLADIRTQIAVIKEWVRQPYKKPRDLREAWTRELDRVSAFVRAHPRLPQGHYVRGQAHLDLGALEEAERDLAEATRLAPGFAPAWGLIARVKLDRQYRQNYIYEEREREAAFSGSVRLLREAEEALVRARPAGRDPLESWGFSRTREDEVHEKLFEALQANFLNKDSARAARLLLEAQEKAPAEEYCLMLAHLATSPEEQGRWQDEALRIAPHFSTAAFDRGNRRWRQGDWDGSLKDFTLVLEFNPGDVLAWTNRGNVWQDKKDFRRAIEDHSRAIEIDPRHGPAHHNRALARQESGDLDGAIADFTRAIELDPGRATPCSGRGEALRLKKDLDGALRDHDRAVALGPKEANAWLHRARTLEARGDLDGALADYGRAIGCRADHPQALSNRGSLRLLRGDVKGALEDTSRAVEIDGKNAGAWVNRGNALFQAGDRAGAFKDYLRAAELDPGLAKAHANLGLVLSADGNPEGAGLAFTRALELDPRNAEIFALRGDSAQFKGDLEAAIRDYTRALELDPRQPRALDHRGIAYWTRREFDAAIVDHTKAIELDPKHAKSWMNRGNALQGKGDLRGAIADFSKAIELDPRSALCRFNRGNARRAAGELKGAIEDFTGALEIDPRDFRMLANRGNALLAGGNAEGAIRDYDRALEILPAGSADRATIQGLLDAARGRKP